MQKTFDAFIFDLDGTLLDTLPDLVVLTNRALCEAGFPARSDREILSFVGNGLTSLLEMSVPKNTEEASVEQVMKYWKDLYPTLGTRLTKEYPGITPMLEELVKRGKKTAILSNKFDLGVKQLREEFFSHLFVAAYGESDLIPRKPNPEGLRYVIDKIGGTAETSVYIGDSPNDVFTAHQLGVFCVGVSWGYNSADELVNAGADALALSPSDILKFAG